LKRNRKTERALESLFEYVIEKSKGFFEEKELERFFTALISETNKLGFTNSSYANLERIIKSFFDVRAFVADALAYPHYIEIIASVAHHSNYLTDVIVRNPSAVYKILTPSFLLPPVSEKNVRDEITRGFKRFRKFETRVKFLRRLKNQTMLTIGTRDLLGLSDLRTVTAELSALARAIADELFALCVNEILTRKNIGEKKIEYTIAALGKLGGNELNYSSDIDLIFFFDKNENLGEFDTFEILSAAISLFAETAVKSTADGFLYRVDFRLRPDGKYSPLVKSYADYVRYYETRGENWERQMLLKLAFVGGGRTLFERFAKRIEPFVYPSEIPSNHFESVRKMKTQIEESAGSSYDIKKISGGIRDVEFAIQVLQTLNGKRERSVREANTLTAIEKLLANGLLEKEEAKTLAENYTLYRKIEHYLQLVNDTQTHVIPKEGETLEKLVAFLGYSSTRRFFDNLKKRRLRTRKIFNSILSAENSFAEETQAIDFADKKKAARNFAFIFKGENISGAKRFDKFTIEKAYRIEKPLKEILTELAFPDVALENFAKVLSVAKFPSLFFGELADEKFLRLLLTLCENSQMFVNSIVQRPEFLESFLSRAALSTDFSRFSSIAKLRFSLSVQFGANLLDANEIGEILSSFIKGKIAALAKKYFGDKVFVAALGTLARGEMNFSSDADLLIIARKNYAKEDVAEKAREFLAALNKEISPFTADLRLRPEGESAQLVWDIEAVKRYFEKRVSAWELIAFSKARFVAGDKPTFEKFTEIYAGKIAAVNRTETVRELREIYRKVISAKTKFVSAFNIKYSHGGLTTVDFVSIPNVIFNETPENIMAAMLGKAKLQEDKGLLAARKTLQRLLLALQTTFDTSKHLLPLDGEKKKQFERALAQLNLSEDYRNLNSIKNYVKKKFAETYE
jgi:glutamate-ammonia-ligase adenylyltransferase